MEKEELEKKEKKKFGYKESIICISLLMVSQIIRLLNPSLPKEGKVFALVAIIIGIIFIIVAAIKKKEKGVFWYLPIVIISYII